MNIQFQTPHQYVFIHENVKHLLLIWSKEAKKQLFIVEEKENSLYLQYPGETYEEMVFNQVESLFFRYLETEEGTVSVVLGATFQYGNDYIAMYYSRDQAETDLYFFRIEDEELADIPDEQYEKIAQAFLEEFPEYITNTDVEGTGSRH